LIEFGFCILFQLSQALLQKETLDYDEVETLIGPPPFGKKHMIRQEEFEVGVNEDAGVPKDTTPTEPLPGPPPIRERTSNNNSDVPPQQQ
jgi:spastic paraplegia protein 7